MTVKMQTHEEDIGYIGAAAVVFEEDGLSGLLFRGLTIKLISNGISAILFTILWKYFMELYSARNPAPAPYAGDKKDGPELVEVVESPPPPAATQGLNVRTRRVQAST